MTDIIAEQHDGWGADRTEFFAETEWHCARDRGYAREDASPAFEHPERTTVAAHRRTSILIIAGLAMALALTGCAGPQYAPYDHSFPTRRSSDLTYDFEAHGHIVDMHIHHLRQKIDDGFECRLIHAVAGAEIGRASCRERT